MKNEMASFSQDPHSSGNRCVVFPLASCLKLEDFHGWETGGTDNEEFSFSNAIKSQR